MPNKMLIDATHPEETRVVVLRGNRVEEFDFESANRKQLRGNIYLAKVTRVEPSLQAAFVDYGGNRHGFLAFSEIHPDYYQIPVADRQALIDEEERAQRDADAEADNYARRRAERGAHRRQERIASEPVDGHDGDHDEHHDDEPRREPRDGGGERSHGAAGRRRRSAAGEHDAPPADTTQEVTPAEALAVTAADETPIDLERLQSSADDAGAVADRRDDGGRIRAAVDGKPRRRRASTRSLTAANGHGDDNGDGDNITEVSRASGGDEEVIEVGRRRRCHGRSAGAHAPRRAASTRSRK